MKNVVEHLSNLIRIPSVSSVSNRAIIDYAVEALHEARWQTRLMPYQDTAANEKFNLIAAPPGQTLEDPSADLVFMCHTDTVPYSTDWTRALDPFIEDGLLYGCGACDVKGFLACLLTAIGMSVPSRLSEGLRLVLTADEEIGCVGASHLVASGLIRPRKIIIGEPTSLHPARAGKGYCLAEITVFGQEAHSAHPRQGSSAIYGAARLIRAIEELAGELAEKSHSFFDPGFTTLNVGTIQGGTAKNVIAGSCKFQLEWRPIPGEPADAVPVAVSKLAQGIGEADPRLRFEVKVLRQQPGFETSGDAQLVRSIEGLTGRSAISIPFGSEASLFAPLAEEAVVFGPGDMKTAHSNRECVPVDELNQTVRCLLALMSPE